MKNHITIFTDGSARGNPGPGGWGAIVIYPQKNDMRVRELGGNEAHTTNNRMELMGAIKAIEFTKKTINDSLVTIHLYSDSQYVIKGMTEWISNWKAKGWRTANKKPVLNQDLWQALSDVARNLKIEWKYVAGHSGHDANERCDEIATTFADNESTKLFNGLMTEYKIKING